MANPTLDLSYSQLLTRVGFEVGYGADSAAWTAAQDATVDRIVAAGLRDFYFNSLDEKGLPYRWSFLKPEQSIVVWPTISGVVSGTPVFGDPESTFTVASTQFYPSMRCEDAHTENRYVEFETSGNTYRLMSYVNSGANVVVTVDGDASGETADDTISVTADGDYFLPAYFAGVEGNLYFDTASQRTQVFMRPIHVILANRQASGTQPQIPQFGAVQVVAPQGALSARWRLMIWPIPDGVYTLRYVGPILADAIDGTDMYQFGGAGHAETMVAACLAQAESQLRDGPGARAAEYARRVALSVALDRSVAVPQNLGRMRADASDEYDGDPWLAAKYAGRQSMTGSWI